MFNQALSQLGALLDKESGICNDALLEKRGRAGGQLSAWAWRSRGL